MESSDNCIVEFESACRELVSAKYILADKKISKLLQTIAKNSRLYTLVGECMIDFDFKSEFIKSKGNFVPTKLTLPFERKKIVAFVFCLLLSFDTNQTDLKKFLHTFYFRHNGPTEEFEAFAEEAILPFSMAVAKIYYNEPDDTIPQGFQAQEQFEAPIEVADKMPYASEQTYSQARAGYFATEQINEMLDNVREMICTVARDSSLEPQEREELLLLCEGLEQAITLGAQKPIRTMFIALKYTIRASTLYKKLEQNCTILDMIINETTENQ